MANKSEQFINDRIVGGYSLHDEHKPELCTASTYCGPWRVVECGGFAGADRDILECTVCGEQRNVRCNFDEDMS